MSNRSLRKSRHRSDKGLTLTFAQRTALGSAHAALVRGDINYNDLPQWMRDVSKTAEQEAELNEVVQEKIDEQVQLLTVKPDHDHIVPALDVTQGVEPPVTDTYHRHVHGDKCNHE